MDDFDEEIGGRRIPSVFDKWSRPGESHTGTLIAKPQVRVVTDFQTKMIKTFSSGEPMKQFVLSLATDEREASVEGDDGERRLYVKGRNKKRLGDAIREAGLTTIGAGDVVTVTFVSQDATTNEKVYGYKVTRGRPAESHEKAGQARKTLHAASPVSADEPPF